MVAQESSNSDGGGVILDDTIRDSLREFLEKVEKESSDDFKTLNFEFLEIRKEQTNLQASEEYRCSVGQKIAHYMRNRYRDILPYDKTRVLLKATSSNADGYINASHICHPQTSGKYIAAQAPLSTTVEDFWTMIFENNITIVGMLCKCIENGMPKCERYWTDDEDSGEICDNMTAFKIEEHAYDDFVYRKLKVKSAKHGVEDKIIHQLNYTEWPDHGCPNGEKNVLEFMELLNKLRAENDKKHPVLLHCSAGCGRTGTVIALDTFKELLTTGKLSKVDLKQLVIELRKQRVCMVQTPGQYQFLHKAIALYCKKYLDLTSKPTVTTSPSTERKSSANTNGTHNLFSKSDLTEGNAAITSSSSTAENENQAVDVRF
ncbi:protein-tyrosine phosphatase domain-containing protein [Ditylenchus destructor]|nr:protein-tyrosine phosphatase domain-containing protein [Ditylenchus destructor]